MLTVKYREMLAIACAEKSYGEFDNARILAHFRIPALT